jgi:hypothetical protein
VDGRNFYSGNFVWYVIPHNSCYVYIIKRIYIMSMERHTLRAVKLTQNIFELNRVNKELIAVRKIVIELEQRKMELISS